MLLLAIAVAGGLGAVARAGVDELVLTRRGGSFPLAILMINTSGSFVLGIITGLVLYHGLGSDPRAIFGTGFCGGYTTFSTFAVQTVFLADQREHVHARHYLISSAALPVIAASIGIALASL